MGHHGNLFVPRSDFSDRVAQGVLAAPAARRLQDFEVHVAVGWEPMNAESMSKIIYHIGNDDETRIEFLSLFAKFVHDRLNTDIRDGAGGVEVENQLGDKWKLSGDKTLVLSPQTLAIAQKAVAQSQQNVIAAGQIGQAGSLDPADLARKVWAFVPQPTSAGSKPFRR